MGHRQHGTVMRCACGAGQKQRQRQMLTKGCVGGGGGGGRGAPFPEPAGGGYPREGGRQTGPRRGGVRGTPTHVPPRDPPDALIILRGAPWGDLPAPFAELRPVFGLPLSKGSTSGAAPPCDIPSGCCSFTGPWTVTRSSLRMLRRVAAFCRPLRPVLLLVSFPRSRSPVVGVLGLC